MISLQNFTTYSILSGIMEPDKWVEKAAELGYSALAITDKNYLAGHVEFQKECDKHGIQPILGGEYNFTTDVSKRNNNNGADVKGVLLFLAKNDEGVKNLISLNNLAHKREGGFYYRPRLDLASLKGYGEGLVCICPAVEGYGLQKTEALYELFKIFGEDFYLGLNPFITEESTYLEDARKLCSLPWKKVFVYNCHVPSKEHAHLYPIVREVDKAKGGMNSNFDREVEFGWLPSQDEYEEQVKSFSELMKMNDESVTRIEQNMLEVTDKCQGRLELGTYHMPQPQLETGTVKGDFLKFILEGWKKKICKVDIDELSSLDDLDQFLPLLEVAYPEEHLAKGEDPETWGLQTADVYLDRLKYELSVIEEMGYLDYFLVIRDVCMWAKRNGIEMNPGRGSAAGALVSYLLGITKVDPIRHGLLFERFLNPDRNDLPDVDLDFEKDRREDIKEYVAKTYGKEHVAGIVSFQRWKVVSAIKDIARAFAYGVPDNDGNIVSYTSSKLNAIMSNLFTTQTARGEEQLQELLGYSSFKKFYDRHSNWFDKVVMPLQDSVTNVSVHPAGLIITPEPLDVCLPCIEHSSQGLLAQYKDRNVEERGFPKFDFLGVRNIDKVAYAKKLIKERHGIEVPPLEEIPLDDPKALKLFNDVKTEGIFQFLTYSQRKYLKVLKPKTLAHLFAAVALIRPGPIDANAHLEYADIVNGKKKPTYDHPDLEPILESTNGLLVYQETMMDIVKEIGGLDGSQADYVRKACGKKKPEEMRKWESVFIEGGLENGYDKDFLEDLWSKIVAFAEYSFNKSHAVSYTLLSYYQAWIKVRWPVEYWSAVMQYAHHDAYKEENIMDYKHHIKKDGIKFVFPNIDGFAADFKPADDHSIYWPLAAINGIGSRAAEELTKDGRSSFESMLEMIEVLDGQAVNKTSFQALIKAGFFNTRCKPWEAVKQYFALRQSVQGKKDDIPYELDHEDVFEWTQLRNDSFKMIVESWKDIAPFTEGCEVLYDEDVAQVADGTLLIIGGQVEKIYNRTTKYEDDYAKLVIVDDGESHNVMCWSEFWTDVELDKLGRRPKAGDLVQLLVEKNSFSPKDSDKTFHNFSIGKKDPYRIKIIKFDEED